MKSLSFPTIHFAPNLKKRTKQKYRNIYLKLKIKRQSKVNVEIALSDAIFVFRISAARAQLESEYQGKKSANQTKVPFVGAYRK